SRSGLPRLNSCVIEGEIQAPESFDSLVQSRRQTLDARYVAPDGERPPALFLDHAGCFSIPSFGNVGYHHTRSLACERQSRRAPDAVPSTSHECDLSLEISFSVRIH